MLTTEEFQAHLTAAGIRGFTVTRCAPISRDSDIRAFFRRRAEQLRSRRPEAPVLRTIGPALKRLSEVPADETIYRWEAVSDVGRIVGYSTINKFIGVYPWIMKEREWVGSMIRY